MRTILAGFLPPGSTINHPVFMLIFPSSLLQQPPTQQTLAHTQPTTTGEPRRIWAPRLVNAGVCRVFSFSFSFISNHGERDRRRGWERERRRSRGEGEGKGACASKSASSRQLRQDKRQYLVRQQSIIVGHINSRLLQWLRQVRRRHCRIVEA